MYTNKNLEVIHDNDPYTGADGTNYPRNHPKGDIPTDVEKLRELFLVTEVPRPPNTETEITTGFHIDENHKQVWDTRSKTVEELQSDKNHHNAILDKEIREESYKALEAMLDNDTEKLDQHKANRVVLKASKKV